MATPTPYQLVQPRPTYRKVVTYKRDLYNFSGESVSHGSNTPVPIPSCGPHAAGAVRPQRARQIESVEVTQVVKS